MTQVDMPQLSLRRYVDLVKRRRWQVVPVSLLGLLIGGLVAFFIPRLYVAETLLIHQQLPEGPADKDKPFRVIVDSAKSSLPVYVKDAIEELNWPEVRALDPFDQEQFYRDCESRINVTELSGGDKTRTYVTMRVRYKDRDGARSADLLNKLVEVWIRQRTQELRDPAESQRKEARDKADAALKALSDFRLDLQQIRQANGLDPGFGSGALQQDFNRMMAELTERNRAQEQRRMDAEALAVTIKDLDDRLSETIPRIKPPVDFILVRANQIPELQPLVTAANYALRCYTVTFREGTKYHETWKQRYLTQIKAIEQLLPAIQVDEDGKVENPDFTKLREEIAAKVAEQKVLAAAIKRIDDEVANERKDLERRSEALALYEAKQQQLTEAEEDRKVAVEALRKADEVLAHLQQDVPVRQSRAALIPPQPTEPNIMVVALAGSVLGLFAAIGLILLFDLLQGSFKTVEDVERGLSVPVLGGVSHLETEEERVTTARSRRRASLVAAAALLLVTAVVSVFYIDPTRLPPAVRSILTIILGA